ncbi:sulfatase [Chloroflexota bacterium]
MKNLNRRDVLKLLGLLPAAYALNQFSNLNISGNPSMQNVLILVFDAFSAHHLPFHGYGRDTAPNLTKLLDKAIVYHNHYAASNFTTPGTASLLTGAYPWSHRAFNLNSTVTDEFENNNIFSAFSSYTRAAYTHNPYAHNFLLQFKKHIDHLAPKHELYLNYSYIFDQLTENDWDVVRFTKRRVIGPTPYPLVSSLYLNQILSHFDARQKQTVEDQYSDLFPSGIPAVDQNYYFLLEQAIDWTYAQLDQINQPFLGYYHYYPPHDPYRTRIEFEADFHNDDYPLINKPLNVFSSGMTEDQIYAKNTRYDRSIRYLDSEFYRLYQLLESSGLTDNTWIIFTSDHGELFERGMTGHTSEFVYEPVIKIPLIIFEPGRTERLDIHTNTSATDILPTIVKITSQNPQAASEGQLLPPFNSASLDSRPIFSIDARRNPRNQPLRTYSAAIIKDRFKLIQYAGYPELDTGMILSELYDLENDPHELNNLVKSHPQMLSLLTQELNTKIEEVNAPFEK